MLGPLLISTTFSIIEFPIKLIYGIFHGLVSWIIEKIKSRFVGRKKKVYPSWIKVNDFAMESHEPIYTINITPDPKIINYFESQTKDTKSHIEYKGKGFVVIENLLRFNRFYTLTEEDITVYGQFAMKKFLEKYYRGDLKVIYRINANMIGYIFKGIILGYAIQHNASQEVIDSIKEFGRGTTYSKFFLFTDPWIPLGELSFTPHIVYETGQYLYRSDKTPEELNLEELHVVEHPWQQKKPGSTKHPKRTSIPPYMKF
ncbi:hypothetical protein TVAG_426810 [Trichomonas vaginalis G3]|uniref:Uncharacterized protein n=1 Tax=Trichomonas vaginalis (strain ATCC PRA-98 / G3) TaxID=412133 RepID=A2DYU7_TRIV3|nr:hypothetical protein TVAGG3_0538740 [Trichomonas vaginalis G3]EAY14487.1 hypothetical protein TVAG_426810 [Trichomonas vaginalis G3]KAI5519679.1 hypothetical protein TVAGG3_0538740 [Trichomonas vaginalis G3]|eukprot:XP_001326710.1 hypothetical protein [Trichomonas vaginalis G3]